MARISTARLAILGMAAALAATLAGCADDGPRRGPPPGGFRGGGPDGPGGPGGPVANLFVSPAGKVFRGRPGEPYPAAAWFAAADADHDGRLTRAEFVADAETYFRVLDENHDGQIDGFELADYEKSMPEMDPQVAGLRAGEGMDPNLGEERGERGRRFGGGGGRGGGGPPPGGGGRGGVGQFALFDDPEPVSAADFDLSGRVTLAEFRRQAEQRFAVLDKTSAGALTLADLPKTPVQRRAEGPPPGRNGRPQAGAARAPQRLVSPPAIATSEAHHEG